MHDGLKKVTLVLENCERIEIPRKWIGEFRLAGIETVIARLGCNYVGKYEFAKEFAIEIFKGADADEYRPFGQLEKGSKFDRLTRYADVTHVELEFDDENGILSYAVDYETKDGEEGLLGAENANQSTKISKLGNLYLVVQKGGTVDDVFPDDVVNDAESMELCMESFDVGIDEEEERPLDAENLPEFYRYVQLYETTNDDVGIDYRTAIRVPDAESGWKFVYEPRILGELGDGESPFLNFPNGWRYHESNVAEFLQERLSEAKDGFTPDELRKRFPLSKKSEFDSKKT